MSIRIDRKSIKKAVRKANFPKDYDIGDIELALEKDAIDAIENLGIKNGKYRIVPGEFNYDIIVDKKGRKIAKKVDL